MIELLSSDPHALYVLSAYAGTGLILGLLIGATLRESAKSKRDLQDAERSRTR